MEDADLRENMLEESDPELDPELEIRLENVFMEIVEETYGIISSVNLLRSRMSHMMSQIVSWQKFRRCLTAFNIFAIPIILAIGIAYSTAGMLTSGSMIETGLDTLMRFLMFLSISNGLPLYIYFLRDVYFFEDEEEDNSGISDDLVSDSMNESELTLEDMAEILVHIAAFRSACRVFLELAAGDGNNQDEQEREDNQQNRIDSTGFSAPTIQLPAAFNNNQITSTDNKQIFDLDFEDFLDSNIGSSEPSDEEQDEYWKIINVNPLEDIVNGDVDEIVKSIVDDILLKVENTQAKGFCNIPVKNARERNTNVKLEDTRSNVVTY